jgi:hypothetical protein
MLTCQTPSRDLIMAYDARASTPMPGLVKSFGFEQHLPSHNQREKCNWDLRGCLACNPPRSLVVGSLGHAEATPKANLESLASGLSFHVTAQQ